MKTVAIQGVMGSYHELVALNYFGEDIERLECESFEKVCSCIANKEADYGVLAIENSVVGTILPNLNLIRKNRLHIIGESYLEIHYSLVALKGNSIEDIKTVISHPMALGQCVRFVHEKIPNAVPVLDSDTALAAKKIADSHLSYMGAIAHEKVASLYNLDILEKNIETDPRNYTLFSILSREEEKAEDSNKTFFSLAIPHKQGSLLKVLDVINKYKINILKLESVPVIAKPHDHGIFISTEYNEDHMHQLMLEELKSFASDFNLFGIYKNGDKDILK